MVEHHVEPSEEANSLHESENSSETLKESILGAHETLTLGRLPNGGRPLPEWAKDIDQNFLEYFLREYGHLVEFV